MSVVDSLEELLVTFHLLFAEGTQVLDPCATDSSSVLPILAKLSFQVFSSSTLCVSAQNLNKCNNYEMKNWNKKCFLLVAYTESGNGNPTGLRPVGSENPPFVVGITRAYIPAFGLHSGPRDAHHSGRIFRSHGPSARGISTFPKDQNSFPKDQNSFPKGQNSFPRHFGPVDLGGFWAKKKACDREKY